mmetsp:Transcript_110567/g.253148  ORF Transcript_110567/g.253148 Transcript_110567/m.253148 type:complete len:200 (-) Transcript_110567:1942-2541(-)
MVVRACSSRVLNSSTNRRFSSSTSSSTFRSSSRWVRRRSAFWISSLDSMSRLRLAASHSPRLHLLAAASCPAALRSWSLAWASNFAASSLARCRLVTASFSSALSRWPSFAARCPSSICLSARARAQRTFSSASACLISAACRAVLSSMASTCAFCNCAVSRCTTGAAGASTVAAATGAARAAVSCACKLASRWWAASS